MDLGNFIACMQKAYHHISHRRTTQPQVHLVVGPVNEAGLRGTVATKDIASGELILQIPNSATIDVGDYSLPGAVSHCYLCNGNSEVKQMSSLPDLDS